MKAHYHVTFYLDTGDKIETVIPISDELSREEIIRDLNYADERIWDTLTGAHVALQIGDVTVSSEHLLYDHELQAVDIYACKIGEGQINGDRD